MPDERIVVEFTTQNLPQTQGQIDDLQNNAIGGFTELNSQLELFTAALGGLQGIAGALYGSLIDSNEQLNAELLKSQVALASTLDIYQNGTKIDNIGDKIISSAGTLKDSLKQIEKDTTELAGVTTQQVNGVFQILLQNASSFIGQSKEFSNPIDAATNATKGWAAALGTLGLPLEQANQEIRSILQGDVNNPDSVIAKTLAISREQYDQWVSNGVLIDEINKKLAVYVEGNKLASVSIGAVASNIQSLFEDTARMAGEPLLAPVTSSLNEVYQTLLKNRDLIEELTKENVADLLSLFNTLTQSVKDIGDAFNITPEGFLTGGSELIGNLITAAEGLIKLGVSIAGIFGPILSTALGNTFTTLSFGLEGIGKLANLLTVATDALGNFTQATASLGGGFDLGKVFNDAQANVAKLTGEYQDSIEAVETYRDVTATLTAQAEKIASSGKASSAMVRGQIDALEKQKESLKGMKTFREADNVAVEAQITAIEKSIKTLEGLKTAQDDLTFKAPELQKLGTMMEVLGKNAESALATLNRDGGGKKEVFEEAAKSVTELTAKQVEYGQITAAQGIGRLDTVVKNTKLELETRESALEAMKGLEKDFTDFKVAQLDLEAAAVERKVKQGTMSAIEGAKAGLDISKKQTDVQVASLDSQIEKAKELGQSTEKLALEREQLVSKQADTELDSLEKIAEIREKDQEDAYQKTLSAAKASETQRLLALEKGLASKKVTEGQYNTQTLEATKERLGAEIEAEEDNQAKLQDLLKGAATADQREEIEKKIADSKQKSAELTLNATKTEGAAVKAAAEERLKAVKDSFDKSKGVAELAESQTTLTLKKQLADRQISQQEYDQKVSNATKTRLSIELKATNEQVTKLAALAASQGGNQAATEALTEAKKKQIAISQQLADVDIKGQKDATAARLKAIEEGYQKSMGEAGAAETEATIALKQGLLDRTKTQEQYDAEVLANRRTRIQAEQAAEAENVSKLQALLGSAKGDERKELEDKITAAKERSKKATESLLDLELQARDKIISAYKEQLAQKLQAADLGFSEQAAKVRQSVDNEAQAQSDIAKINIDRIRAQMQAEEEAANQLASLGDTKGAEQKRLEVRKLAIGLIDAEIAAEKSLQNIVKAALDERKQQLDLSYAEQEAQIRRNVDSEAKAQTEIANLAIERIKAQMAEEERALEKLARVGDTQGVAAKKKDLRKLAIGLIDAEIAAEKALQSAIKNELDLLKKRLDLRKGEGEINILEDELALAQQVNEGTITKEQAEKKKLGFARARIEAELELLRGLEGKGDESDKQKNQQDQLKLKAQLLDLDTQMSEKGNEQLAALQKASELRNLSFENQKQNLAHIVALSELEAQSVARTSQLRQAQSGLVSAQLQSLETGLSNELSLVNAALAARTKLSDIEKQLATDTKLTAEQRTAMEREALALRSQLAALGKEGGKTEEQLINQRQQAEQNQIKVKREQLALSIEMGALELANQRAAIEMDKIRADFKAQELELEAQKLAIQADQLEAQAGLTKDKDEAKALAAQAANLRNQVDRTKELGEAQRQSSEQEAELRNKLLDSQAKISELQSKSQEETLDTQQKLLNSQQNYERSLKGLSPRIDTKSVDAFSNKIKDIREEIKKVATVSLPTLKLTPSNIEVKVKDDRTVAPLRAIQRASTEQTNQLKGVGKSVAPLAGKLDAVTKAVKAIEVSKGGGQDTTVKNQVTVNVAGGGPKPQVTVKNLINNRKKECDTCR